MSMVARSKAHRSLWSSPSLRAAAGAGAALLFLALSSGCDGGGGSGEGGGGSGGSGGGGSSGSISCPASPSLERIATGLFEYPPQVPGQGIARISSVLVSGQDVYYLMGDYEGPSIRHVTADGQDTIVLQDDLYRPVSQLVSANSRLYWFDEGTQPGRVMGMPIGGGTPEVVFDGVRIGLLNEVEQYFGDGDAHFIHANVPTPDGHWQNQILRKDSVQGTTTILYSRENGASGDAYGLSYAYMGDVFYVVGSPNNGTQDYKILRVDQAGPAVDPANPPSIAPTFDFMCDTLVARGSDLLWCLRPFEGAMDNKGDRIRALRFGPDGAAIASEDVFNISDDGVANGGALTGRAATDGHSLFFVTQASDGTGNVTSILYQTTFSNGTFTTKVLACDLPEVVDMTIGNGFVYFAAFEPESDKVDHNGVFRIAY